MVDRSGSKRPEPPKVHSPTNAMRPARGAPLHRQRPQRGGTRRIVFRGHARGEPCDGLPSDCRATGSIKLTSGLAPSRVRVGLVAGRCYLTGVKFDSRMVVHQARPHGSQRGAARVGPLDGRSSRRKGARSPL